MISRWTFFPVFSYSLVPLQYMMSFNILQAEQKAREESEKLRQQEREQIAEKRKQDLVCFPNNFCAALIVLFA